MNDYEYEKYKCCNLQEVQTSLNNYGVAIVPNILSYQECQEMINLMWNYLEHITQRFEIPMNRNNINTWKEFKKLYPSHSMLLQRWGIGQSEFVWYLRQKPQILAIFAAIWNTTPEQLLVSFDGAAFHFPPEVTQSGYLKKTWLHSDQCFLRNDFECIQSWVTAYPVNAGDATLNFLEGSNKYHKAFRDFKGKEYEPIFKKGGDWYKLEKQDELDFYMKTCNCPSKFIACPAGSLVLWDSRTIHCGTEAIEGREHMNLRCISYLCYTPHSFASQAIINKRIKIVNELRTSNHYPHKPILFSKLPYTYGQPIANVTPILPPTNITEIGRKLIGY